MAGTSDTFFCPHCSVSLTKSAAASILGSIESGALLGNLPPTVTCPACGGAINTQKMIAGAYDSGAGSTLGCIIAAVVGIGGTYWINQSFGYNLFASAAIVYGVIVGLGLCLVGVMHLWKKRR